MRKRIITEVKPVSVLDDQHWLNVGELAEAEITSEDAAHPIEAALLAGRTSGWRAATPGKQTIRLVFSHPQRLQRIWLKFEEASVERTQEYVLRWSHDGGKSFNEIVRQQWNFSPSGSTDQTEDCRIDLANVTVLELNIIPNISGGNAVASLAQMRIA
jgi:hypothetical protein